MTNGDVIRQMTDESLYLCLGGGGVYDCGIDVSQCDEGCELYLTLSPGCDKRCSMKQKEKALIDWIGKEVE